MTVLTWDNVGERVYESGLDRGVLYLPDGSAVPWNGLRSVIERVHKESSAVYYDGMKIRDNVVIGDFTASMRALTYPDEFAELEGLGAIRNGVFAGHQKPKMFGLCYRTKIGNDLDSEAGYKIHILYNVTAIAQDKDYSSTSDRTTPIEFEWDITAVPEEIPGHRPTAHYTIVSTEVDPLMLEDLEAMLYGNSEADASLVPMDELVTYISEWYRILITDNEDGTWTAVSDRDEFIDVDPVTGLITITEANVVYLDPDTYVISDTMDESDIT